MMAMYARSRGLETTLVRLVVVTVFAVLTLLSSVSMATAAPQIIGCQFTNPLAYELKSLLTTRAYFRVSEAGSWARLDILGANGVVKTMYNGPVNQANVDVWTPVWNGLDATGRRLPSASYDWRLTVSKGGQSTTQRGKITISKIHFFVTARGWDMGSQVFERYMIPGTANFYLAATSSTWDTIWFELYNWRYYGDSPTYNLYPGQYLNQTLYARGSDAITTRGSMYIEFPYMADECWYYMTVIQ